MSQAKEKSPGSKSTEPKLADERQSMPPQEADPPVEEDAHVTFAEMFPDCDGCKYNRPGQDDHMGLGGCLYEDAAHLRI
jgi:hypothetical protein